MALEDSSYTLQYLGHGLIHSYFTDSMLQWIIGEIELCRRAHNVSMILMTNSLELKRNFVSRIPSVSDKNAALENMNLSEDLMKFDDLGNINNSNDDEINSNSISHVVESMLHVEYKTILRAAKLDFRESAYFVLLTRESREQPIICHAFRADANLVSILHRDLQKRIKLENKNGLTHNINNRVTGGDNLNENNDNDCVRFEVMMIGIVNLKNPDPPHTLIDEAVVEFNERYKKLEQRRNDLGYGHNKANITQHFPTPPDCIDSGSPPSSFMDDSREGSIHMLQEMRKRCGSMDHHVQKPAITRRRQRHCSEPSTYANDMKKTRIRLFQIGHKSIKMICPNKTIQNSEIEFSNISRCMQGIKFRDHFGIIANSTEIGKQGQEDMAGIKPRNITKKIICYIFKCAEDYICEEIMQGIRQAFATCFNDTSPMQEFDELCKDINAASPKDALLIAKQKMRILDENEVQCIKAQILEINPKNSEDKLFAFMAALRQLYEVKHVKHLSESKTSTSVQHDLQNSGSSKFDNIKSKAISSFGSLLLKGKKKMQELQLEGEHMSDKHTTSPVAKLKFFAESLSTSAPNTPQKNFSPSKSSSSFHNNEGNGMRRRSTSLGSKPSSMDFSLKTSAPPMLFYHNIFYSITNTGPCAKPGHTSSGYKYNKLESICEKPLKQYKTSEDVRRLWKWAISQQILLNKINAVIEQPSVPLSVEYESDPLSNYSDLDYIPDEMEDIWAELFNLSIEQKGKIEKRVLRAAVQKGVLGSYRAKVWKLLRNQRQDVGGGTKFDLGDYPRLLDNLTCYQHAILIDIGRTFPSHPMYSQLLGPGQLSLFNVLKAYSLYDKEVGYCQGLSFIAGVLLMHTCVEDEAYQLLFCLMHEIGCRNMYLPDMTGMKLAMFKITRLLYDLDLEIFKFFELHDVTMMLVATPWFLTMFASTFPMNFVARVFDMVFVDGTSALFKVAICLLLEHKSKFIQLDDFEDAVNFIRTEIPKSDSKTLATVIENAMKLDVEEKLKEYEVEYRILHEELPMYTYHAEKYEHLNEQIQCLESVNHKVTESNCDLLRQLHDTQHKVAVLQKQLREVNKSRKNDN